MMHLAAMILFASITRAHSTSSCFVYSSSVASVRRFVAPNPSSSLTSRLRPLSFSSSSSSSSSPSPSSSAGGGEGDGIEDDRINVSRLSTLQALLSIWGAPGSVGCNLGNGDLIPVPPRSSSSCSSEYRDLHPHLLPLARSASSGHVICALRRGYADDVEYFDAPALLARPWPIVESAVGLPGMRLLSLNSEHLMRRIAADADARGGGGRWWER